MRGAESKKQARYGFRLMWREVPDTMKRCRIGAVGSFDPQNGHNGVCWGWPKECQLTETQARNIYLKIWQKKTLTYFQMVVVRKAFAYAYELRGGEPKGNFKGVKKVWSVVRKELLAAAQGRVLPERIPSVEDLRIAFTKEWTPAHSMNLVKFSSAVVSAYDGFVCGMRPNEDVDRVKKSRHHTFDWRNRWECTSYKGGRAKLAGEKRGTRPWGVWTVCFCKGNGHQRPPARFNRRIDKAGNPRSPEDVTWTTTCPLACLELLWQLQDQPRRYGKWLDSGRFGKSNIADPVALAIDWFETQGLCTGSTRFDHNSGRKCCARWTRALELEYEHLLQIVGDLEI